MNKPDELTHATPESTTALYYVVRDAQTAVESANLGLPTAQELDEIDEIRKMIMDVDSDPPQFYTST